MGWDFHSGAVHDTYLKWIVSDSIDAVHTVCSIENSPTAEGQ